MMMSKVLFSKTCPKHYFQKKNSKYDILNHLYFGPNFVFLGTALGRFSQCFFLTIKRLPTAKRSYKLYCHGHFIHKNKNNKSLTYSIIRANLQMITLNGVPNWGNYLGSYQNYWPDHFLAKFVFPKTLQLVYHFTIYGCRFI